MSTTIPVATLVRKYNQMRGASGSAQIGGNIRQTANGRPAVVQGLNNANMAANVLLTQSPEGIFQVPKAAVSLLDGGNAYVNLASGNISYKPGGNQDFLIGTVAGDAPASATTCNVLLGLEARPVLDLARDAFTVTPVLTAGVPSITRYGGAHLLLIDATNEAEKIDALSDPGFQYAANVTGCIFEAEVNVTADDSSTHAIFSIGMASATHATAFASIAHATGFQVKAHDGKIYAISNDAATPLAATDTTKTYAAGTAFQVWIDFRVPSAVVLYVNGIAVLTTTPIDVSAYTGALYLLAHLVKTATTDTMQVKVNFARLRGMSM